VFGRDGKTFFAGLGPVGSLGLFDLRTLQLTARYEHDCQGAGQPVLQPGDKAVLIVVSGFPNYLCLFDLEAKRSRIVLPEKQGFHSLRGPSFIGQDEILFIGQGAMDPDIVAKVKALGANPLTTDIPYRLKFGGKPEIAFPEIIERNKGRANGSFTSIDRLARKRAMKRRASIPASWESPIGTIFSSLIAE
jgi:hypothetical protein